MKIHMEIELAEDIDCNEEKPVKPTPVEEKPTPVKEQAEEEDAEIHELKEQPPFAQTREQWRSSWKEEEK